MVTAKLRRTAGTCRGFSLVELMVAMVLGLMLIGGVIQVFVGNKLMFDTNIGVARMQENARFALAEIARDLRMAGYRGCNSDAVQLANLVKIGNVANDFFGFDATLLGFDAEANQWSDVIAATYATANDLSGAADRVVIKSLDRDLLRLAAPLESTATSLTLQAVKNVSADDLLFVGDCEKGATVAVTGVSGSTVEFGGAENLSLPLTADQSRFVTADTLVHQFQVKSYFIARSQAYTNNRGERPWSLWRRVNNRAAEELAVGVQDLQLLYGVDNNTDGIPDTFVRASTGLDMENVVVVRVQVTTNGIDENAEGLVSRDFTLTVQLRNRLAG